MPVMVKAPTVFYSSPSPIVWILLTSTTIKMRTYISTHKNIDLDNKVMLLRYALKMCKHYLLMCLRYICVRHPKLHAVRDMFIVENLMFVLIIFIKCSSR